MKFSPFEKLGVLPRFSNKPMLPSGTACVAPAAKPRVAHGAFRAFMLAMMTLLASAATAQDRLSATNAPEAMHYGWADVLRVDPVFEEGTASEPQQECYEEQVLVQPAQASEPDDGKRVGGTVLGAIIGGVIGNRFGKGDGRKAATAAGAVAGGAIGNNLASNDGGTRVSPPRYTTQRRCRQIEGAGPRHAVAYDVEYRYRGELYTARMNTDPGDRMRVRVSVTPAE